MCTERHVLGDLDAEVERAGHGDVLRAVEVLLEVAEHVLVVAAGGNTSTKRNNCVLNGGWRIAHSRVRSVHQLKR